MIVEENEFFYVQVEQIVSSDDLRFPLNPEFTAVTIIDNDGGVSLFLYAQLFYIFHLLSLSATCSQNNPYG